jgi:hypothetical protein
MKVILDPGNPFDFDDDELNDLADQIRRLEPDDIVTVAKRPEHGYGVTLIEVLNLYLDIAGAAGTVLGTIKAVRQSVEWLQQRWRKDSEDNPEQGPRPRSLCVYDENGKLLGRVRIDEPNGEAVGDSGDDETGFRESPPQAS